MKLTRSVGYAVGILLRVESGGAGGPMTADAISRGCKFPPRFLYRVLRRLVDAGLLEGISGPRGGYLLAKRSRQIRLLDIVEAVDEASDATALVAVCRPQKPAIALVNELCDRQTQQLRRELSRVTLARMAQLCVPRGSRGKKKGGRKSARGAGRKA